jgi:DNA gyrase subunit B
MARAYDANSIESLQFPENVRKRPDMYMGATTGKFAPALFRGLREIIDNSLDEYLCDHNSNLYIFYDTKSSVCTVIDNGRGIPTEINDKTGKSALFLVFGQLHAGGKFDKDSYKVSSGKNGVGCKGTNALSEWLVAFSNNNKTKTWMCQRFKRGIADGGLTAAKIPSEFKSCIKKTGTIVQFKPDSQIFKDGIEMDIARLKRELRDIQYLCPKLNIQLNIDGQVTSYYSETGLTELVCDGKEYEHVFSYTAENIDAAIAFTKKDGSSFKSYVNIVYTDMGGTHLAGFKKIICDIVKENSKKDIASDDILEGMVGAIHYKMAEPQYQSQTKNELTSVEAKKDVMDLLEQPLRKFFRKNKDLLDRIVKYAEKMYAEKQKMKANKDLLKGLKTINSAARYISEKFLDADRRKYRNVGDLEMFVVEGDSAGGHFSKARDGFQACLKLRGKIINAAKASDADLFGSSKKGSEKDGNREIKDLTAALGCGVLDQYNERNLRFGKLIIMTDADSDGCHITNLVLAFLVKYMPDLIKNGHVYTIDAPLFMANGPSFRVYGMSRNEVEKKMRDQKCKQYTITRLKGWGECDAEDLSALCVSPKTRKLIQMKWDDETMETLEQTMAGDSEFRKILLDVK